MRLFGNSKLRPHEAYSYYFDRETLTPCGQLVSRGSIGLSVVRLCLDDDLNKHIHSGDRIVHFNFPLGDPYILDIDSGAARQIRCMTDLVLTPQPDLFAYANIDPNMQWMSYKRERFTEAATFWAFKSGDDFGLAIPHPYDEAMILLTSGEVHRPDDSLQFIPVNDVRFYNHE